MSAGDVGTQVSQRNAIVINTAFNRGGFAISRRKRSGTSPDLRLHYPALYRLLKATLPPFTRCALSFSIRAIKRHITQLQTIGFVNGSAVWSVLVRFPAGWYRHASVVQVDFATCRFRPLCTQGQAIARYQQ